MKIQRLKNNPIISYKTLNVSQHTPININGPSLIKVPEWINNKVGKYYLYFADHRGTYIRMAYADNLNDEWTLYEPGTLQLEDALGCIDHIASPDLHVDNERKQIRMYFHGVDKNIKRQFSYTATSSDGLSFIAAENPIADFYLRTVKYKDIWFGMSKGGKMYFSKDGISKFQQIRKNPFKDYHEVNDTSFNKKGNVRHVALHIENNYLNVFYTKIGDKPESIYNGIIDLALPSSEWKIKNESIVLKPEYAWEGGNLPFEESKFGASKKPENALRDPGIFVEDEKKYLLYSIAGEQGIAIAEIKKDDKKNK